MTMPDERTRAVIQTYEFLVELSRNPSLPEKVRRDAKFLLQHYPSKADMERAVQTVEIPVSLAGIVEPVSVIQGMVEARHRSQCYRGIKGLITTEEFGWSRLAPWAE